MNFSEALDLIKRGKFLCRLGWNGKEQYVFLISCKGTSIRPHILFRACDGSVVPWVASQTDLLADDWELFL